MVQREQFEASVDEFMQHEVARLFADIPQIDHLINDEQPLNDAYYCRHRIETIARIRMTAKTDALALAQLVEEDYEAARLWGKYITQELNHDLLYLKDLREHGYSDDEILNTPPFSSTVRLIEFIATRLESIGALAAVAYSIWAEWNSERVSARVVERATRHYSDRHVLGSKAHVGIDENEDHYRVMLDIAYRLIERHGDPTILFDLLSGLSNYLGDYFLELYEATAAGRLHAGNLEAAAT